MKLTTKMLKQIIKEEMKKLQEGFGDFDSDVELSHMGTTYGPPGSPRDRPAPTWEDELEMKWDGLTDDQQDQCGDLQGEDLLDRINVLEAEIERLKTERLEGM